LKPAFLFLPLLLTATLCTGQVTAEHHITVDGIDRFYLVFVPEGIELGKKCALVVVLHGGGGKAKQIMDFSGFNRIAQTERFIVLYPNGYEKGWHDGRTAPKVDAYAKNIDDIKFIKTAIEQVEAKFPVDNSRIFATGISNGAMMSLHLAQHLSEKIRAIAPVAGSIAENVAQEFKPSNPVSVLVINGTDDKLVPYDGGPVLSERAGRGRVISTMKMMELLASLANSKGKPSTERMPDHDPEDGCTADRINYSTSQVMSVQLIRINGGGHTWPGGKQYLPKMIVGKVCRDFKAEEIIWNFFKTQSPR
jgi:polyhydroxybutyrate depolymerase